MIKVDRKDSESISNAMTALAARTGANMSWLFKTVTSDNGSEFSTLENDLASTTQVYFCHPYASYERGSSENQHKLIRRSIPKGKGIGAVSETHALRTQRWMNQYPRKILEYRTPQETFMAEMKRAA